MCALIIALTFSVSVELNKTFLLPAPVTDVITWASENQRAIATAMFWEVVEDTGGDTLRVRRRSPKGEWEVTIRLHTPCTETPRGTEASLDVELLEVHRGSLKSQAFTVKLVPEGAGTRLEIHATADVPNLGRIALLGGLDASLKGFTRLIEKRWPR